MIFVCENIDCPDYGMEEEVSRTRYRLVDGEMVSDNAPCPVCGCRRREISEDMPLSEKNVHFGDVRMSTVEGRREMLKQRSHDHYEREIRPEKEERIRQAMGRFNNI